MYGQERALFETFAASVSCVESLVYAVAAALSSSSVLSLPFGPDEQRKCSPKLLSKELALFSKAAPIKELLVALTASPEWDVLVAVRNRLSHRGNLPRILYAAMGSELPPPKAIEFDATTSTPRLSGELTSVDHLLSWVTATTTNLIVELTELLKT